MAGKPVSWKMPDLRRAIKVAHSQGLVVTSCDIARDGHITIHTDDRYREVTAPPPDDVGRAA